MVSGDSEHLGVTPGNLPPILSRVQRRQAVSEDSTVQPANASGSRTRDVYDFTSKC